MIADNNRLIEIDPAGNTTWSLDSTTEQVTIGDVAPTTESGSSTQTPAATVVSLSRPSSISELDAGDILFADSGNNRCVRVDRSGNVLWELTAFADPSGLLAPGQPMTLDHPSSVVEWREQYVDTSVTPYAEFMIEHYLVADSGNYRVVEVDDMYSEVGGVLTPVPNDFHALHWVTHTYDQLGRKYRYVSAAPYTDQYGHPGVVAAVSNLQIAPLISTTYAGNSVAILDSAAKDSPGSSVVVFSYNPTSTYSNYSPTPNLDTSTTPYAPDVQVYSPGTPWAFPADSWAYPFNGLPDLLINHVAYIPTGTPVTLLPLRNLHFITVYVPVGSTVNNVLIADDDGVFDGPVGVLPGTVGNYSGYVDTTQTTNTANPGFYFNATDYAAMIAAAASNLATADPYPPTVFIPTSAQHLSNGDFLITNGASVGDSRPWDTGNAAANNLQSGGCVFEVIPTSKDSSPVSLFGRSIPNGAGATSPPPTGPTNTGPLSQPAFAYRTQ